MNERNAEAKPVTPREEELREQRDDEAWMHAACLTIAETGQKWGDNVYASPAMKAVYNLYPQSSKERE